MQRRAPHRGTSVWLLAAMAASGPVAAGGPPPLPDDFLEYLGSWEADDADWLVANAGELTTARRAPSPTATTPATGRKTTTTSSPRGATPAPGTERKP